MTDNAFRILLADDDNEDQDLIKEVILELDPACILEMVSNGQEAVDYLTNCPDAALPSLIILDYKMPILGAIDVLNRIGNDSRYAGIPKVVWSTSGQQEHIDRCIEKGALHYFTKPSSPADLMLMAKQLLAMRNI